MPQFTIMVNAASGNQYGAFYHGRETRTAAIKIVLPKMRPDFLNIISTD
jgi:hypothetical protein